MKTPIRLIKKATKYLQSRIKFAGFSIFIVLTTLSCSSHLSKSNSKFDDKIISSAKQMAENLRVGNYGNFIDAIYPGFVQSVGGRSKMLQEIKAGFQNLENRGIKIDSVAFSKPNEIISHGKELQTTLLETLLLSTPKGLMISKSTLIAISSDSGLSWNFIDTSGREIKKMKKTFPNLSNKLIIAEQEKPVLYSH